MLADEVKQLLLSNFPNAVINVKGEDQNFSVDVISPLFDNLNKLNRQKKILSCVKEKIASGEIHAFSVQAYTLDEWYQNSRSLPVL